MAGSRFVSVLVTIALVCAAACGRKGQRPAPNAGVAAKTPAAGPPPASASPLAAAPVWAGFEPEAGPVITAHAVKMSDMSPTEQKYGIAPERGKGIDFQDHIVLVEHGDRAIQSWDTNGLGWTLDASNPQIANLKQGDILFATSRCVGRVLKLTRDGQKVSVIRARADPGRDQARQSDVPRTARSQRADSNRSAR